MVAVCSKQVQRSFSGVAERQRCHLCLVVSQKERVEVEAALSNELDEPRAAERKLATSKRELERTVISQENDEHLGPCNKAGGMH